MFSYQAFGLTIQSELELPELSPCNGSSGSCDVRIQLHALGIIAGASVSFHHFAADRQTFAYPGVGAFVINGSDEILIEPAPTSKPNMLALPLLGPVMGLLLHLRGRFVLHGSAVSLPGVAFGFLGDKGAGKSTLAAALLKNASMALLSDDLVAFNDRAEIFPAFPQLKLSSEALAMAKGLDADLMPAPAPDFPKHQVRMRNEVKSQLVSTRALYELRRDSRAWIEPLGRADALSALIRFAYVVRFGTRKLEPTEHQRFFRQAADIANTVQIARLYVPDSIDQLSQVAGLLSGQ